MRGLTIGFLVAALAVLSPIAEAAAQQPLSLTPNNNVLASRKLPLAVGKSQVVQVNRPIGKVAVGNPDVADVSALSEHSFYILGKKPGTTNVSIYEKGTSRLLAVVDVTVGVDIEAVKASLHDMLPSETINVRNVNGGLALSGVLSSPAAIDQAILIADRFTDKDKVINNMRVRGNVQVMLQVKVAEMSRSLTKELGFKPFFAVGHSTSQIIPYASNLPQGGAVNPAVSNPGFALSTLEPLDLSRFASVAAQAVTGNFALNLALDALEDKGAVKILAEPNLVAMSGDTASFLAGGEFPVPVSQNTSAGVPTITVEFKPFGVSLAFTPTVIEGDLINIVVAPEVSQIDKQNSVVFNGFVIPGISTRRAHTTIEMRDGQSFAIAGLLQSTFADDVKGIPGVNDIPVIGALVRDSQFQRNETELVIIVTPRLVHPAMAAQLAAPTDSFVPPSDADLFFFGRTEAPDSGLRQRGGGLTGHYGHIIR